MKIVQVKYANPNMVRELEYGYCLVLESLLDLAKYDSSAKGVYESGFYDAIKTMEGNHSTTMLGHAVCIAARRGKKSLIDGFIDVTSKAFQAKWRAIENLGKVYIQPNGSSFFVPCEGIVEVGEPLEIDNLKAWGLANKQQPRFIQWQGGSHYYVKCGTIDVEVNGEQKWNTLAAAKAAYNAWINRGEML